MNHLKKISTFSVTLPAYADFLKIAESHLFSEAPEDSIAVNIGFVGNAITKELVTPLPTSGYHFIVRIDQKKVPKDVLVQALTKRVAELESMGERKIGRKERSIISEDIAIELMKKAFWHTRNINCFYRDGRLFVSNCPSNLIGATMRFLVHACGELQAQTLHLSDVKHGLTTRIKDYLKNLEDSDYPACGFGSLHPAGKIKLALKDEITKKVSFDVGEIDFDYNEIKSLLESGYQVTALELTAPNLCTFTLNEKAQVSGVQFDGEEEMVAEMQDESEDGTVDGVYVWRKTADSRVYACEHICQTLLEMFKPEESDQQEAA